jgi:L-alanine-DL-glutamate epimerase-like enolase superfamily enzyme
LTPTTQRERNTMHIDRRHFLGSAAAAGLASSFPGRLHARPQDVRIKKIERVTVKVPYRETPGRNMARELPHWRYVEIFSVHLSSGVVGHGETLLYYTWRATKDADVDRAHGGNAAKLMWDDTLGAGLQMALFDAVAKTVDAPVHALLGNQVYEKTPLSWWNIDTSAKDMAAECKEAYRQGYMAYKTKGRPWYDVRNQLIVASKDVPPEFKIDMDFNDTLLTAEQAIPILKDLAEHPQVDIYETPIPQRDIPGNQKIRAATRVKIAMHYGTPSPKDVIRYGVCDGFVIGRGPSDLMRSGALAAAADLPFWLQLVGTGITAAFSLHFGAVLTHARWPAVNCHQLYQHQMLKEPIRVKDGFAAVPEGPGLGHAIDWDAVEKYRVEKPKSRPEPERLLEVSWPDGDRLYVGSNGRVNFMLTVGQRGNMPFYKEGADTRLVPDDGSTEWRELYQAARKKPVLRR